MSISMHAIATGGRRGEGVHTFPENLGATRLLLRSFLGQCDASRSPDDRVSHVSIFRSFACKPHPSQI